MISEKMMLTELMAFSKTDLLNYPILATSDHVKHQLKNIYLAFSKKDLIKIDRYSWPNAMIALSLTYGLRHDQLEFISVIKVYLDRWIDEGQKINTIDNLMNGMSLMYLFEKTGDEKYKVALHKMIAFVINCKKSFEGSIPYRQKNTESIYVDAIGILCPFLYRYALIFKDDSIRDLANNQICSFIKNGIDELTGLPVHGYQADTKTKMGILGWGRGVGWYLCGLADSLEGVEKGSETYLFLSNELIKRLELVLKYQYSDGFFGWLLILDRGQCDISATSMILYAAAKAVALGLFEYHTLSVTFERGLTALQSAYRDGQMSSCSAECGGFSIYPQTYGSYPWGNAPTIAFLALLEDIKI